MKFHCLKTTQKVPEVCLETRKLRKKIQTRSLTLDGKSVPSHFTIAHLLDDRMGHVRTSKKDNFIAPSVFITLETISYSIDHIQATWNMNSFVPYGTPRLIQFDCKTEFPGTRNNPLNGHPKSNKFNYFLIPARWSMDIHSVALHPYSHWKGDEEKWSSSTLAYLQSQNFIPMRWK